MDYRRHKEAPPEWTVARVREILSGLGIALEEAPLCPVEGLHSVVLRDARHGWQVNGKGATVAYCLASGYGEAMERLQSGYAYDTHATSEAAKEYGGFLRAPDEQAVPLTDLPDRAPAIWAAMRAAWAGTDEAADDAEMMADWQELTSGYVRMTPYWAVGARKAVALPDDAISRLDGSNGLASGNTPEEALCQGFCEVLERYVCTALLRQRLVPPPVPREYLERTHPALAETIRRVEALGPFHLCVRDASMGRGYPVVGVALVDQARQRYHVKFGAHPSFAVALERCLTELLQGYTPGDAAQDDALLTPWRAAPDAGYDDEANLRRMLRDNTGAFPDSFFVGEPSWAFFPWSADDGYTNAMGIRSLAQLLLALGGEVYIRDMGFLGMPTYRVYVPGISTVPPSMSRTDVRDMRTRGMLAAMNDRYCELTEGQRATAIEFLRRNGVGSGLDFIDGIPVPLVRAALLCDDGDPLAAAEVLRGLAVETNKYRCAAMELALAHQGMVREDRDAMLALFFGERCARYAMLHWRGASMVRGMFRSPMRRLARRALPEADAAQRQEALDALHMRVKDAMVLGLRDQTAIGALFA